MARGSEAQPTVLQSKASKPALFHPSGQQRHGRTGASERPKERAWLDCINIAARFLESRLKPP
jgi:hypothetical protein